MTSKDPSDGGASQRDSQEDTEKVLDRLNRCFTPRNAGIPTPTENNLGDVLKEVWVGDAGPQLTSEAEMIRRAVAALRANNFSGRARGFDWFYHGQPLLVKSTATLNDCSAIT